MNDNSNKDWRVEVFHDGACPLCAKEIAMLRRRDRHDRILFTDITADGFNAADYGKRQQDLMDVIHGRLPDGTWLQGVDVFRRLYTAIGFGPLVALTRVPGISQSLSWGYDHWAKNRLKLTGRCDSETCEVPEAT